MAVLAEQRRVAIKEITLIEAKRVERRKNRDREATPKSSRDRTHTRESLGVDPIPITNV